MTIMYHVRWRRQTKGVLTRTRAATHPPTPTLAVLLFNQTI